jgi:aminoglycoside phosphotransferase (APT) family kinase protein
MDLATARRRLAALWGVSVQVNEVYVEHQERVVFRTATPAGRRVVVKAFADPDRLAAEAVALHAAAAAGVPVPEVVDRFPDMLVLGWLDGQPLLSSSPDRHWAAAGRTLRRLHDHATTAGVTGFAGIVGVNRTAGIAGSDERSGADDVPPECLLHGDSASIHWRIRSDGTAAMLDLGDACVGDPVWDLVVLTHWDEARLPAVLDGYRADDALRARVGRLYEPYRVVRHLLAVEWLVDHGYDPAPTLRELRRIATQLVTG